MVSIRARPIDRAMPHWIKPLFSRGFAASLREPGRDEVLWLRLIFHEGVK
jgi:hypothetical protein